MKLIKPVLVIVVVLSLLCSACQTTANDFAEDPNFIGDYGPIQLENIICIRESFGRLAPTEIEVYFIPRTNIVEMYLRDDMTAYVLLFEGEERKQVYEGITKYAELYSEYAEGDVAALENRSPNRNNNFNEGTMSVSWGVLGAAKNNVTTFQTNYKYLEENKPYFQLLVEQTKDKESSAYSPALRLYFSPTHLENVLEILDQKNLELRVAELEAEAFAF